MITLKNLSKTFHTKNGDVHAIHDINLQIDKGDIFGIIGLSGAGKSTLVRCINFLEVPTGGDVLLEGKSLGSLSRKELLQARRSMGMIFQQFNLLMQRTALDNVLFPLELSGMKKSEAKARGLELLELVGLSDRAKSYPSQLSGGQKQRIAIARALATNPKVLLCDESTSALDPTTTRSILNLLQEINQKLGVTIIIITHEMAVIEEICQKVAIIHESTIAECGTVAEVFSNPQSHITKRLIYPDKLPQSHFPENTRVIRIIFDGLSSFQPVIGQMVLECKTSVNILYADTRNIEGNAVGQMMIQLPEDPLAQQRMLHYLTQQRIQFEEVTP